jgi:tetratricopeptide (TPR) repeat protein
LLARYRVSLLGLAAKADMSQLLRLERAQEHLERASALVPGDPDLLVVWSDYWWKRGDTARAYETLQKLREIAPDALATQLALGDQHERAAELAEASSSYGQAVAARPGDVRPYRQLIRLFAHSDWLEEHRAELDALVERRVVLSVDDDAGYGTHLEVGRALKKAGDLETARFWFQRAAATDGRRQDAYIELAMLEGDVATTRRRRQRSRRLPRSCRSRST